MLTPRSQRWHRLKTDNPFLWKQKEVRLWFEEATRRLFDFRYSAGANYASQQHEVYNCLGAFGTGAMYIDRLDAGGLRYKAMHVGELFFLENHQGVVDTAFRVFTMTARQAAENMTVAEVNALRQAALALEATPEAASDAVYRSGPDNDFHRLIARGSRNQWLEGLLIRDVYSLLRIYRVQAARRPDVSDSLAEHQAIIDRIHARDGEGAEAAMRAHLRRARERVLQLARG